MFTPPDGASPVEAIALVVRVDPDGLALSFVHLAYVWWYFRHDPDAAEGAA